MYISVQSRTVKDEVRKYVYLLESIRDPETGKNTKRKIKNFGRLDLLEKENPGFLEELKRKYKSREDRAKERQALAVLSEDYIDSDEPDSDLYDAYSESFIYGHFVLKRLWTDVLKMHDPLTYLKNQKYKIEYDLNSVVSTLVFKKALGGGSIRDTYNTRCQFLGAPKESVSLSDMYRSLDIIQENKDMLIGRINRALNEEYGEDRFSMLFYDVTNTYFETSMTDEEKGLVQDDFLENLVARIEEAISLKILPAEALTTDGMPNYEVLPQSFMDEIRDEKIQYLRQRGPSKEHRFDLPIVSVVLVIDKYGLPVDYDVFAGNKSEFHTMRPVIEGLQTKYSIKNAIVVADRGLNSAQNLNMIKSLGMGFIIAQKVSNLGTYEKKMLDSEGYQNIYPDDPTSKYKVVSDYTKRSPDGNDIKCNLIFTFDENRKKRDDTLIDQAVAMVEQKLKEKAKISLRKGGYAAYATTKDKSDGREITGVDQEYVKKKRAIAGYTGIVFSSPEDCDLANQISADKVAALYGQLNRIERCFRIMKSNLGLRPMYVYTSTHVKAHILLCFMALTLVCLLEKKLHDDGHFLSIDQIIEVMNNMTLSKAKISKKKEPVYIVNKAISDDRTYRANDVSNEGVVKEAPLKHAQFEIMRVVGLYRLPSVVSKTTLSGCLRTKFPLTEEDSIYI